ncbi:tyrosine-type recombinase/integrase [Halorarum salinum]|uniref:Site-specific integrase n=1 Tax=Halorarum salinum TaxID=2743089 RepID=A0A7D5QIH8_9EURY|nr:site-specific integrase [Halobaculum salinum]QLG63044.1 site-specific integrase [Halobaculum salinum]
MSETQSYEIRIGATTDGGSRVPDLTPREAFERWLGRLRGSKADSTVSAYHYQLKLFIEWCEDESITPINDLTGWDIETYETHRRETGIELISLNKELGTLKQFLEYCARIELVDENLPEKVDPPDVPKEEQVDNTRLHTDDARALLAHYETDDFGSRAHALLSLAWFVGARLGGLRSLDLKHYDSDDEYLQFVHRPDEDTPLKNGLDGERAVGLPRHVCDVVDAYIANHRHDTFDEYGRKPLFTSSVGRGSENSVRVWMYMATFPCHHSPCPHGKESDTCEFIDHTQASKCPSSRSPHQVRTGSITWQLNRGVPIEVVAKRVNTSVRTLEKHYDQPTKREELEERRRQFVDRLDFGGSGGEQE